MEVFDETSQTGIEKLNWPVIDPSGLSSRQKVIFHEIFSHYGACINLDLQIEVISHKESTKGDLKLAKIASMKIVKPARYSFF